MPIVELERRLVKSPPEVWHELASSNRLSSRLGDVRVTLVDPPHMLIWHAPGASGLIRLESLGWGTKIRVQGDTDRAPAWERLQARYALKRSLGELLDDLSKNSLRSGGNTGEHGRGVHQRDRLRPRVDPGDRKPLPPVP
jgi:hypothetical protein